MPGSSVLVRAPLFAGLSAEEQAALARQMRRRRFAPGQVIFLQGDAGTSLYVIEAGQVKISLPSPEGRELVIALLGPGDFFGELALLDGEPHSADAIAQEGSTLWLLLRADFLRFVAACPSVATKLLAALTQRARKNAELVQETAFLDAPARLAKALLHLAQPQAGGMPARGATTPRLTQSDLASIVGATRETVNKCLSAFARQGLIRRQGGMIVIVEPDGLRARSA